MPRPCLQRLAPRGEIVGVQKAVGPRAVQSRQRASSGPSLPRHETGTDRGSEMAAGDVRSMKSRAVRREYRDADDRRRPKR